MCGVTINVAQGVIKIPVKIVKTDFSSKIFHINSVSIPEKWLICITSEYDTYNFTFNLFELSFL